MPKILIVEDEPLAVKRLTRLLNELAPDFEIYAVLDSVADTVKFLDSEKVDLIFMDIHLADGNSFSIFEQVKSPVKTPIIFSTAYDQALMESRVERIGEEKVTEGIASLTKPIDVAPLQHRHRQDSVRRRLAFLLS